VTAAAHLHIDVCYSRWSIHRLHYGRLRGLRIVTRLYRVANARSSNRAAGLRQSPVLCPTMKSEKVLVDAYLVRRHTVDKNLKPMRMYSKYGFRDCPAVHYGHLDIIAVADSGTLQWYCRYSPPRTPRRSSMMRHEQTSKHHHSSIICLMGISESTQAIW
jgi:hypothetical protein